MNHSKSYALKKKNTLSNTKIFNLVCLAHLSQRCQKCYNVKREEVSAT